MTAALAMPSAYTPPDQVPDDILRCRGPHRDPRRPHDICGGILCGPALGIHLEFIGIVARVPDRRTIYWHEPCPRCGAVNKFRIVATGAT